MLYEHPSSPATPVIAPQQLAEMNQMLFEVTQTGTGKRADLSPRPAAAKTGTSQDWRDAWFIGYTADLVTGGWVGNDDNSAMAKVVGGSIPATIWKAYMVAASKDLPVRTLPGIDMFGQTGEDYAAEMHVAPGEDMPWVERGERRERRQDRGALERFLDDIFGGSDDEEPVPAPPPPERYAPRSELGPTSSTPRSQTPMASAPPSSGPRVITVPASAPPVASGPDSGTKAAESEGPYRQPQPDENAGSPF
jgi:membrane peptidoglycan carboxypeptidase